MRIADHRKERLWLYQIIDDKIGVENFVPAMLGIRLRKHHQFDIGRIAPQTGKDREQIVDFVLGQREGQLLIRGHQRRSAASQRDVVQRARRCSRKQ